MTPSPEGFLYPEINKKKCIHCGLCIKVCDFKQFIPTGEKPQCYAVRHKDMEEVNTSRSGGFFMALCKYTIEHSGIVFGCEIDDELRIIHKYRETYDECKKFKGSKYVQSDLQNTFVQCEEFLNKGKLVLFSGTGCQIHGLLRYLNCRNVSTDRLITVDIVCHGTPSPGVWSNYIQALEKREKRRLQSVDFREKIVHGWAAHIEKYVFDDGTVKFARNWTTAFYRHILLRECCHSCKYTTTGRKSDFTIADYWGLEKNAPEFNDNKGCSLVLVHSEKGRNLFKEVGGYINFVETELSQSMQPQLGRPIWKGWDRKLFWSIYRKNNQRAVAMWIFPSRATKAIWKIETFIKQQIKKLLRR